MKKIHINKDLKEYIMKQGKTVKCVNCEAQITVNNLEELKNYNWYVIGGDKYYFCCPNCDVVELDK